MIRNIDATLMEWKNTPARRPILLHGARQVGKTYTIRAFGKKYFSSFIEIDFKLSPQYKRCFTSCDPHEINQKISVLCGEKITPGSTLIFFDEIQACPDAIESLKHYFQKMPSLHVIGAGSLLEFTFATNEIAVPADRINCLYMQPMSFWEFCMAINEGRVIKMISSLDYLRCCDTTIHHYALNLLRTYCITGGLPAVVNEYRTSRDVSQCHCVQSSILRMLRDDFSTYAGRTQQRHLEIILASTPKMVGNSCKYANIDRKIPARELKNALELLVKAGLIYRVLDTGSLPGKKHGRFKCILFDTGLMQHMCGYTFDILQSDDLLSLHCGAIAQQLVGVELVATADPEKKPELHYWTRAAKSSTASIDYCMEQNQKTIPIEVKNGPPGKLKSLHLFLSAHNHENAVVISQKRFLTEKGLQYLPLYAINHIRKLL